MFYPAKLFFSAGVDLFTFQAHGFTNQTDPFTTSMPNIFEDRFNIGCIIKQVMLIRRLAEYDLQNSLSAY